MNSDIPEYRPREEREPDDEQVEGEGGEPRPDEPKGAPVTRSVGDEDVTRAYEELADGSHPAPEDDQAPIVPDAAAAAGSFAGEHPDESLLLELVYELVEPQELQDSVRRHIAVCSFCQELMHEVVGTSRRLDQGARGRPLDVGTGPYIAPEARTRLAGGRAPSTRERGDDRGRTLSGLLSSLSDAASAPDSRLPGMAPPAQSLREVDHRSSAPPDSGAAAGAPERSEAEIARSSRLRALGSSAADTSPPTAPTPGGTPEAPGDAVAVGPTAGGEGSRRTRRKLTLASLALALAAVLCVWVGISMQHGAVSVRAEPSIFRDLHGPSSYREGDVHRFSVAVRAVGNSPGTPDPDARGGSAPLETAVVTASLVDSGGAELGRITEEIHGSAVLELPARFATVRGPVEFVLECSAGGMTSRDVLQLPVDSERPVAHLQLDAGVYEQGDTVRWRALVLDRLGLRRAVGPGRVEFQLRDSVGELVAEMRATLTQGVAGGEWVLPRNAQGGRYLLSVTAAVPEATATLVEGGLAPARVAAGNILLAQRAFHVVAPRARPATSPPARTGAAIELYPEGGELGLGVPCRLYCQVRAASGPPLAQAEATLEDDRGRVLQRTVTDARGRARFEFVPEIAHSYVVEVQHGRSGVARQAVPKPWVRAVTLRSVRDTYLEGDPVEVEVSGVTSGVAALYCRGVLVGAERLPPDPARSVRTVAIAPWRSVSGVQRVTIFVAGDPDAGGATQVGRPLPLRPAAERLVYIEPSRWVEVDLQPVQDEVLPGQEVAVRVRTTDEQGQPVAARLGLSVCERTGLVVPLAGDILLGTDVADLEESTLASCGTPGERLAVDLTLGTQGWRRFVAGPTTGDSAVPSHLQIVDRTDPAVQRLEAAEGRREGAMRFSNRDSVTQEHAAVAGQRGRQYARGSSLFRLGGFLLVLGLIFPALALVAMAMRSLSEEAGGRTRSAIVTVLLLTSPLILAAMPAILSALRGLTSAELQHPGGLNELGELPMLELVGGTGARRVAPGWLGLEVATARDGPEIGASAADSGATDSRGAGRWTGADAAPRRAATPAQGGAILREFRHVMDLDRETPDAARVLYWNPDLRTDASGQASIRFDTSDLETEWKVIAEAHAPGRLGDGRSSFEARRSFDLEGVSIPGEITAGDQFIVQVDLGNRLDRPLELVARLEFFPRESFLAVDPVPIDVPARGRVVTRLAASSLPGLLHEQTVRARVVVSDAGARQLHIADVRVVPQGFRVRLGAGAVMPGNAGLQVQLDTPFDYTPARAAGALDAFPGPGASVQAAIEGLLDRPALEVEDCVTGVLVSSMALFELPGWQTSAGMRWGGLPRNWSVGFAQRASALLASSGERLLELQGRDGSFSRVGQGQGDEWSTAYALLGLAAIVRLGATTPPGTPRAGWRRGLGGAVSGARASEQVSVRLLDRARAGFTAAAGWLEEQQVVRNRAVASGEAPGPNAMRRLAGDAQAEADIRRAWILWAIAEAGGWNDRVDRAGAIADIKTLAASSEDALVLGLLCRAIEVVGQQGTAASMAGLLSGKQIRDRRAGRLGQMPSAGDTASIEATAVGMLAFASQAMTGSYDDALDWLQPHMGFGALLPTGPATVFYLLARCEEARGGQVAWTQVNFTSGWAQVGTALSLSRAGPAVAGVASSLQVPLQWSDGGWPPRSVGGSSTVTQRIDGGSPASGLVMRYEGAETLLVAGANRITTLTGGGRRLPVLLQVEHWSQVLPGAPDAPLAVAMRLDRENLLLGERVALRVDIQTTGVGTVEGPRLAVGLPAGLRPVEAALEAGRAAGDFDQYLLRDRELYLFWDRLTATDRGFALQLEAVHGGRFTGPASRVTARGVGESWTAPLSVRVSVPR